MRRSKIRKKEVEAKRVRFPIGSGLHVGRFVVMTADIYTQPRRKRHRSKRNAYIYIVQVRAIVNNANWNNTVTQAQVGSCSNTSLMKRDTCSDFNCEFCVVGSCMLPCHTVCTLGHAVTRARNLKYIHTHLSR